MNKIEWSNQAVKQLVKIPKNYREKLEQAIDRLVDFPQIQSDIKKLSGKENKYRMRVGIYRIIFTYVNFIPKIIIIEKIKKRDERTY